MSESQRFKRILTRRAGASSDARVGRIARLAAAGVVAAAIGVPASAALVGNDDVADRPATVPAAGDRVAGGSNSSAAKRGDRDVRRFGASKARAAGAHAPRVQREASKPIYGTTVEKNLPITMADGTILRANVHRPTDPKTGELAPGRFPVVLIETAYGKDLAAYAAGFSDLLGAPEYFVKRGYMAVMVDVRGTGASEGQWSFNDPQEAEDSKEVIDWVADLPGSNGRVGMTGASYLGITQLFAAASVGKNSPLKAIFPMIASNSIFREAVMPGGLLGLEGVTAYLSLTALTNTTNPLIAADPETVAGPLADHLAGLLDFHAGATVDVLTGGPRSEDGAFWRARGPERVLDQIVENKVPAYLVGGFDDVFQGGVFRNYVGLQNAWAGRKTHLAMAPGQQVTGNYQALVGPWFHAGIGSGGPDLEAIQLRWFDRWLKGLRNGVENTSKPLHIIERGRQERELAQWPVPDASVRAYSLAPKGKLTTAPAPAGSANLIWTGVSLPCQRTTETWALGILQLATSQIGLPEPCADSALQPTLPGPLAQTFTTEPFTKAATIAGPITAEVNLKSTTRDAEIIAKVYDVDAGGRAVELTTGGLLASHRAVDEALSWHAKNGLTIYPHHPITHAARQPLVPGKTTTLQVFIPPTVHTFQPGHRLRVVLTTGETPDFIPLPGDIPNLLGGLYTLALGGATPSRLIVPVM